MDDVSNFDEDTDAALSSSATGASDDAALATVVAAWLVTAGVAPLNPHVEAPTVVLSVTGTAPAKTTGTGG
jgi:hypothetical protein